MTSENMDSIYARSKALFLVVCVLIVVMSFAGFANYMTFTDNYNNALANTYAVPGQEFVRSIEYALVYGKPIDNYYGMNDTLRALQEIVPEAEEVYIVSPQGRILYDKNGFVRDGIIAADLTKTATFQESSIGENRSFIFYQEQAYLFVGINDHTQQLAASLLMIFPREQFVQWDSEVSMQLGLILVVIVSVIMLILTVIFFRTNWISGAEKLNKKRMLLVFLTLLGVALITYSGANYKLFQEAYEDMAQTSSDFVQYIATNNLENILDKGLTLEDITGFDNYLATIRDSLPQIETVEEVRGAVNVTISGSYIKQQLNRILLDMGTVTVISVFFMVEMTLLVIVLLAREKIKDKAVTTEISHGMSRSLAFFINFSAFLPFTFIPIYMRHIYEPIAGLPKDVTLGLPLSAEMLGGMLAIILSSWLISRNGWRSVFYLGVLFLIIGNFLSANSTSAIIFIISRAIAGLGLGYILMTTRSLVVSMPNTNSAIAAYAAGAIAGLNCGLVIGGMLADRIGYEMVFTIAALAAAIPFVFVQLFMRSFEIKQQDPATESVFKKMRDFVTDKKAVLFLACLFIPFFIGGAFLDYYFPLFASANELSQSDISRGFLLNGLMIIYLGPLLTRYVNNKFGNVNGIIASMVIVLIALTVYVLWGTIAAAFVTVALLGIAESFGLSMKTTYFLQSKGIRDMQINQSVAWFSFMVNTSRMAGPIIFGAAVSIGMRTGIGIIAITMLALILVFVWNENKKTTGGSHESTVAPPQ
ncbi:MFS transporter [Desulfuribacillus alkaliarsenatis]|uniref:Major facilitator superfamily (MFS) profile domain-containing protein n=1 Tax=Desulfuribacillus alkaliarsenatis TaxID=766136 RepID=A0A1E5G2C0_9FIRM|nr:MFS transporter [Desulfuribacillus alkaliarsenatis]OEF97130.1 hypothetical protein BHF68_05915 [Desulfuribacillus alkaliarsenatis]